MSECEPQLLSSYMDGELASADRDRVAQHLRLCPSCARELLLLQEGSQLLREYPFDTINDEELSRIHGAIEAESEQPVWRLGMLVGALAASIMIISSAWLMEIPAATNSGLQATAPMPQWERVAMTLRADPLPQTVNDDGIRLADAGLADWMLDGLGRH